ARTLAPGRGPAALRADAPPRSKLSTRCPFRTAPSTAAPVKPIEWHPVDGIRCAISSSTLKAGLLFTAAHAPTPLHYVFGDLKVLTPSEVQHYTAHARRHSSGAWLMVATRQAHTFDDVFGTPAAQAA
ncbi:hypothetical protein ACFV5J_34640, partial [Streptomyces zaomyceticus]